MYLWTAYKSLISGKIRRPCDSSQPAGSGGGLLSLQSAGWYLELVQLPSGTMGLRNVRRLVELTARLISLGSSGELRSVVKELPWRKTAAGERTVQPSLDSQKKEYRVAPGRHVIDRTMGN